MMIDPSFVPKTPEEFKKCLSDPMWRICSGALYKIIIKGDNDETNLVIPFKPNKSQIKLIKKMWHRNIILKARQLGFTTLACIVWLDTALFTANMRCGIIAQDDGAAKAIFRDKVKFAYLNLPPMLLSQMPLIKDAADELLFSHNNSSIRVATSMRSGTINRLHISEFGKICAKYPDKAAEVITGSIPSVPINGIVIIESTAEGQDGDYYKMCQRAMRLRDQGTELNKKDYRFHFFPWWQEEGYKIDPKSVVISKKDHDYFDVVETKIKAVISLEQRAWYIATRDADFSGDDERMWQEYPSTEQEAFQRSSEGCWFKTQMAQTRKDGRICNIPLMSNIPCNTFWDIGNSDGTAIWVHQKVGMENRFIRFYESWGETYSHAANWLQSLGVVFGTHYLPHDADHVRQGKDTNKSPREMLEELMKGHKFETVARTETLIAGINQTRDIFNTLYFDETHCKEGIAHLDGYKKKWNNRAGCWSDEPCKTDGNSEAADALRQFAQGYKESVKHKPVKKAYVQHGWMG